VIESQAFIKPPAHWAKNITAALAAAVISEAS
jgi:hypothetical protein